MAIKLELKSTIIPIEIGDLKFEVDMTDEKEIPRPEPDAIKFHTHEALKEKKEGETHVFNEKVHSV